MMTTLTTPSESLNIHLHSENDQTLYLNSEYVLVRQSVVLVEDWTTGVFCTVIYCGIWHTPVPSTIVLFNLQHDVLMGTSIWYLDDGRKYIRVSLAV
jgi:hypothetical protein